MKEEDKPEVEEPIDPEAPVEQKAPSRKGKILLLVAIAVILLSIGGGLFFSGVLNKLFKKEEEVKKEEYKSTEQNPSKVSDTPIYKKLDEFLVDLKTGSSASFIKIEIVLKLTNQDSLKALDNKLPIVRDSFISYLRELKSNDLYGSSGLFILKQELLLRVNKVIFPATVEDIYIQNILTR